MTDESNVSSKEIDVVYNRLFREAEDGEYHLNPEIEFTKDLIKGLLVNEKRYGYWACPCRLATGEKFEDLDILCPCDYRDADVLEHGACYCALYVSTSALNEERPIQSIPERRPQRREDRAQIKEKLSTSSNLPSGLSKHVWCCKVCGYLCARDDPPEICPVCKAKKD